MVKQSNSEMRDDVQGLRAVAVTAVLVFHLNHEWLPGGFLGVDIFFVISGFVITQMLLREHLNLLSLRSFYVRRCRRIVPAYALVLMATTLAAALLLSQRDFTHYWASLKHAVTFTSNQYFAGFGEYFAPKSTELPLLHLWSISVEMQFYFLLPLLLFLLPRRHLHWALPVSILLSAGYAAFIGSGDQAPSRAYFSLAGRIPEFLVGASLAAAQWGANWSQAHRRWAAWTGLITVISSLLLLTETTPSLAQLSLIPCLGVALLIAARTSIPSRVLSSAIPVWIGGISYSLYLWHWPVLAFTRYFFGTYAFSSTTIAAAVVPIFALSYLSSRFVEVPFRSACHDRAGTDGLIALLGSAMVITLAGPALNARIGPIYTEQQLRYASPDEICHGNLVGDCLRGAPSSEREWLLLGDSHAAQLNLFFDVVGQKNGFKVRAITASSCVTFVGFDVERIPDWARKPCADQIQRASLYISNATVIVVAGMWQYHASSEAFWAAFERFVSDMDHRGKTVIVFAQVPMPNIDPIRARRFAYLGIPYVGTRRHDWVAANCRMQRLAARFDNAMYFDMSEHPIFLDAPYYESSVIYYDDSHLNERGATLYGEVASALLVPGALSAPPAKPCEWPTQ